jgi:hypothetical protein
MQAGRLGRVFGALNAREKLWNCYNCDMYNNILCMIYFCHPQNIISFNKIFPPNSPWNSTQVTSDLIITHRHTTWEVSRLSARLKVPPSPSKQNIRRRACTIAHIGHCKEQEHMQRRP